MTQDEKKLDKIAMNIVNQILDLTGTSIEIRQQINDECDEFVKTILIEFRNDTLHPPCTCDKCLGLVEAK